MVELNLLQDLDGVLHCVFVVVVVVRISANTPPYFCFVNVTDWKLK